MPSDPIYTLKVTERELYYLREAFEASFKDPDSRNKIEKRVAKKLSELSNKAYEHRKKTKGVSL